MAGTRAQGGPRPRVVALALISPIRIDDELAELGALGAVGSLIAPNLFHHPHLAAAKTRYPQARVLGPAALAAKEPGVTFVPPEVELEPSFRAVLAGTVVEGAPRTAETVWLHVPSRRQAPSADWRKRCPAPFEVCDSKVRRGWMDTRDRR